VPKATASQGPKWAMLICCENPPSTLDRGPGSLPRVDERGVRGRHVAKSHLPMLIIGWRSDGRGSFLGLVLFRLVAPPIQHGVVGLFPGMEYMDPQLFPARENRSYPEFWPYPVAHGTRGIYPDSSPKPSVEQVAGVGHSTMGRTCSHMILWALPRDSVVILWG
jgi:hypothetical protein